jgi:hypothetical protein
VGRHRPDPRGHARILIALAAVALAIALVAVGGVALWGALTSKPARPSPTQSKADPDASAKPTGTAPQSRSAAVKNDALVVRCRVAKCGLFISASPDNEVLFNGFIAQDEVRQFDDPRMNLVVRDGSTVDVYINGKLQPKTQPGKRETYTIIAS